MKVQKIVKEGDVRYNPITKRNERYSPEGRWIPISSKVVLPPTGKELTNRVKEFGLGQSKQNTSTGYMLKHK